MISTYLSLLETNAERDLISDLYDRYQQDMYKTAFAVLHNKSDAEDIVHEAFIRIIKNIHKLQFDSVPKTRALLVTICKNAAIDLYNRKKKVTIGEDIGEIIEVVDFNCFDQYKMVEIREALSKLDIDSKQLLYLCFELGYSVEQVSELFGVTQSAIYKRLAAVKKKLRLELEQEDL